MKKGVELSMNVIIIAAIGLLVLVILAVLVINSAGKVPAAEKSCNLQGGVCAQTCTSGQTIPAGKCDGAGLQCCKVFVATGG